MIAGAPLAPDGLIVLAALLRLHPELDAGGLAPALRAAIAATPVTPSPVEALALAVARRTPAGEPAAPPGRSPASRFLRRWHRRWRVAQAPGTRLPSDLTVAGDVPRQVARLRALLAATPDPAARRDLVAQAPAAIAAQATGAAP
ncbi:MAG: hypothetical protein R3F60_32085 [bacterium]